MIPDITTGQRTFYIGLSSGQYNQTIDIPFRDTSGNIINCNYVRIDAVGGVGSQVGSFVAELSGLSRVGNMTNSQTSAAINTTLPGTTIVSGILGIGSSYSVNCRGEAFWHGSNGEICNGIKLRFVTAGLGGQNTTFGITYGNLLPFNPIRITGFSSGQAAGTQYNLGV